MFTRSRALRTLAAATALCTLTACVSTGTANAITWSQQQCAYGDANACRALPGLQAQAAQEKSDSTTAAAAAVLLIPLAILVGVAASGGGGGGGYHHSYYHRRGW